MEWTEEGTKQKTFFFCEHKVTIQQICINFYRFWNDTLYAVTNVLLLFVYFGILELFCRWRVPRTFYPLSCCLVPDTVKCTMYFLYFVMELFWGAIRWSVPRFFYILSRSCFEALFAEVYNVFSILCLTNLWSVNMLPTHNTRICYRYFFSIFMFFSLIYIIKNNIYVTFYLK